MAIKLNPLGVFFIALAIDPKMLDKRVISDLEWELCTHSGAINYRQYEYSTNYDFGEYVNRCARCGARMGE